MTCIVAVRHNGFTAMGGDCGAIEKSLVIRDRTPKVQQIGNVLVGAAGDYRAARRALDFLKDMAPAIPEASLREMAEVTADLVQRDQRKFFGEKDSAWSLLMARRNEIFEVQAADDDISTVEIWDPFHAIGMANRIALGSLATLHRQMCNPDFQTAYRMAEVALLTTTRFIPVISPPYTILTLPTEDPNDRLDPPDTLRISNGDADQGEDRVRR